MDAWPPHDPRWYDPRWKDRVGDNPEAVLREALRRAVDLRDTIDIEKDAGHKAVFLVDVLNRACDLLGYDTADLWGRP